MKIKNKVLLLLFLLTLIAACQQKRQDTIDSERKITTILNNMDDLNNPLSQKQQKKEVLDTLSDFVLKQNNDSINRKLILQIADKYYNANELDNYEKLTRKILHLATEKKDSMSTAKSLYYIGNYHEKKVILDSAYVYFSNAEKLYKKLKDRHNIGLMKLYKASVLSEAGIYSQSENEGITALYFLSKTNNSRLMDFAYNMIAISLKEQNSWKKSLEYFYLSLKQIENDDYPKKDITFSKSICYNNIGRVYEKMKNYPMAIFYYNKGLSLKNIKEEYPETYAVLLDNLGYALVKSGKTEKAGPLLFESLKIRNRFNNIQGIISSKIDIGEYYLSQKDTLKALAYVKDGLQSAKKSKSNLHIVQALGLLMENDSKNKNYYTKQYIKVKDSLQQLERATKNKFARIAYETDRIEEENQVLSKRIILILGIALGVIFFFGVFFVLYRLKTKNKQLLLIQEQQQANEKIYQLMLNQQAETEAARNEERNRIAMELHDGIVNRIFTTRFNLMRLESDQIDKKEELVVELRNAENEIRRVSHDLQQNLLFVDTGLSELFNKLIADQQNEFNTKFDLTVDKHIDWTLVSGENKIHIYRIVQEAIQNVNKYSNAERCYVLLMKTANKITIRIWDNGIGFNPEKVKYGIGLKNIKERTKMLNGELEITSSSEKGTTIEVVF